jgi:Leucine-rich repeat (LRR) protein
VPSVICRQFANLEQLWVVFSQVTTLSSAAFASCTGLTDLSLSLNSLAFIPGHILPATLRTINLEMNAISDMDVNVFSGLQLTRLHVGMNSLRLLRPQWFATSFASMTEIHAASNQLMTIPEHTFVQFQGLRVLDVSGNGLVTINSRSFQNSLTTLERFTAVNNRISSIDPGFYSRAVNLTHLYLNNNLCVSQNFVDVMNDRNGVRVQLLGCFDNFNNEF